MLLTLLFTNTAFFALTVFSAFVFLAGGLLFFDSWLVDRSKANLLIRGIGFWLLAGATASLVSAEYLAISFPIIQIAKVAGLGMVLLSLTAEPILHAPKKNQAPLIIPLWAWSLTPVITALYLIVAAAFFRKSTEGKEKQIQPAAIGFLFLGLAEALSIRGFWAETTVIFWSKLLAEFGPIWMAQQFLQLIGVGILAIWIWGYVRFRLKLQLFVMTIALTLIIFLSTTVLFTFLLLRNLEADALDHLKTDTAVLQYALQSLQERTLAQAQSIAQDSEMKAAFITQDRSKLSSLAIDILAVHQTSTLALASTSGTVVARAEDSERTNDNISTNPIFVAAAAGQEKSGVTYQEGVTQPEITVQAAVPIRSGNRASGEIIGVVLTGFTIDSAFVDGVKTVTGLDTTVFGQDKRAATTLVAPDGKSRFVGTIETNQTIKEKVLANGETYIGSANVLNRPFYTAYAPLKTADNQVVGMLFVGKPQNTLTAAARRSIDLTFLGSLVLMAISLMPSFFFARFLQEQLEA